eukprot:SAG31_NODE_2263_length_6060_cov_12.232344_4_plen_56_part_00
MSLALNVALVVFRGSFSGGSIVCSAGLLAAAGVNFKTYRLLKEMGPSNNRHDKSM